MMKSVLQPFLRAVALRFTKAVRGWEKQNSSKASRIIGPFVFLQGLLKGKDYKGLFNPQSKFLTKDEQTFAVRPHTL